MIQRRACAVPLLALIFGAGGLMAQEQSRESMAVDATASQWSYQFAMEGNFDYQTDTLEDGQMRQEGPRGFFQFRMVAPIPKSPSLPVTLLPRLTFRMVEQQDTGDYGFGQSDLFVLTIIDQWDKGRWGLGPQINFPAKEGFGNPNWGFGLAGAITQREFDDKVFLALLLQQVWTEDASAESDAVKAAPLGINAIFVYQLGDGWYIGNGDFVIRYSWSDKSLFVPFRVRLGKAFIGESKTWNTYIEYGTALDFKDWQGPVPAHTLRVNIQLQLPVSLGG